jgi:hypothetical protein
MVSGASAQAMCNAQAVHNRLDYSRVHRLSGRAIFAHVGGVCTAFYVGFAEIDTMKNKLLALGVGGTILAALCCFTPLLPVVLTALGLTGLLGVVYSDADLAADIGRISNSDGVRAMATEETKVVLQSTLTCPNCGHAET